jgi:hypothetical protein
MNQRDEPFWIRRLIHERRKPVRRSEYVMPMQPNMNWRKRKKLWKRTIWDNGSNKSVRTYCIVTCTKRPRWQVTGMYG